MVGLPTQVRRESSLMGLDITRDLFGNPVSEYSYLRTMNERNFGFVLRTDLKLRFASVKGIFNFAEFQLKLQFLLL